MFSEKHRHRLAGIEQADSVTVDFHKLFYMPVSCGVFMVRDRAQFEYIRLHAEYLNPDETVPVLDSAGKSFGEFLKSYFVGWGKKEGLPVDEVLKALEGAPWREK